MSLRDDRFDEFARRFVRRYWETIKSGTFSMPPDEPIEETLEELLADVTYVTEFDSNSGAADALYKLRMTSDNGSWWLFGFQNENGRWIPVSCSARSDDDNKPHDLLDDVYSRWFKPFLEYITTAVNSDIAV